MPHTITYEGESTVALDAVLAYIAPDGGSGIGGWFVDIEHTREEDGAPVTTSGWVDDFINPPPGDAVGPRVILQVAHVGDDGSPHRTGQTTTIPTDSMFALNVP